MVNTVKSCALIIIMMMTIPIGWASQVNQMRIWSEPNKTRVVFDLEQPIKYTLRSLNSPNRVLIEMEKATWHGTIDKARFKGSAVNHVSVSEASDKMTITFELSQSYNTKSFLLKPNAAYGHRLVIDLLTPDERAVVPLVNKEVVKPIQNLQSTKTRDFIVAIDAGHGGEDPGAIGVKHQTHEKEIVLNVARQLQALINQQPNMQAILIRQGDYYINLRERTKIARRFGADLFLSLHADSFKDSKAQGASVFILSEHGATSEAARWLAEKENNADLVGGVALDNKSDILASVLLDLSQTATQVGSLELGEKLIASLGQVTVLHNPRVQQAGFVVLKSPDIPSVLIELGFISNPKGEIDLKNKRHQAKLAQAILQGLVSYITPRPNPPMEPHYAWMSRQLHLVQPGETLSEIATQYNISIKKLMKINSLSNTRLDVGQKLVIPFKLES